MSKLEYRDGIKIEGDKIGMLCTHISHSRVVLCLYHGCLKCSNVIGQYEVAYFTYEPLFLQKTQCEAYNNIST